MTGVLAIVLAAYLAAVYLVWNARQDGEPDMADYFRRRAVVAALVAFVVAVGGFVVLGFEASHVFDGLTSRALPLVIASVVCGLGALVLLIRDASRGARLLAVVAVACVIGSWGVAQCPYILPESVTFAGAAAPSGTLTALLVAVGVAVVVVLPGFVLLYVLDQRRLLPEEGVEDVADRTVGTGTG